MRPPVDCLWCIVWPIVYLPLCVGLWLVSLPLVSNFVDINKDFVEVFVITFVCCDELAVDPWN